MNIALILAGAIVVSIFTQFGVFKFCGKMYTDMMSRFIDRMEEKHGEITGIQKHIIVFMECEKYSNAVKSLLGKVILFALLLNIFLLVVMAVILLMRS